MTYDQWKTTDPAELGDEWEIDNALFAYLDGLQQAGRLVPIDEAPKDGTEFKAVLAEEECFGRLKVSGLAIERKADEWFTKEPFIHANLGYALTAHKSQGSEWNDVLVILEPTIRFWGDRRNDALRWLYTSITRAKKNCTLSLGIRL